MSWEALSAIGSLGSAVIIAATAIAAIVQIRHLRAATQLEGFLSLMTEVFDPELVAAGTFIERDLSAKLADERYRQELAGGTYDFVGHPEIRIGRFWEKVGALARRGLIDKPLFLDYNASICPRHWRQLDEVVKLVRQTNPLRWEQFEYLAGLCERYHEGRTRGAPAMKAVRE